MLSASHLTWLEGRALSFGQTISYWPFQEILWRYAGISEDDSEAEAWHKLESRVSALFTENTAEILPYLASLVAQCREWALPVLAEMLPGGFADPARWWTAENIAFACRLGAEMGVDFIKTQYTGDPESFRRVVEATYVPIVVLGGGKRKTVEGLLGTVYGAMQAGAKGVAIGRNIYQYPEPRKITAALAAIIHEGATPEAASRLL